MAVCPRSREEQRWGCWDYCSSRVCRGSLKGGLAHSTWLHVLLRRVSLVWTPLSLPISLEGNLLEDCFSFQVTSCFHPPPPPSPCHLVLPPLQTSDEGFLKLQSKPEKAQWVHIFISFIGGQPRSDHMENIAGRSGKLWDSFLLGPFNIFLEIYLSRYLLALIACWQPHNTWDSSVRCLLRCSDLNPMLCHTPGWEFLSGNRKTCFSSCSFRAQPSA